VLSLGGKKDMGDRILFTEAAAQKLRVKKGDQLICKPISGKPGKIKDAGLLDDFFE